MSNRPGRDNFSGLKPKLQRSEILYRSSGARTPRFYSVNWKSLPALLTLRASGVEEETAPTIKLGPCRSSQDHIGVLSRGPLRRSFDVSRTCPPFQAEPHCLDLSSPGHRVFRVNCHTEGHPTELAPVVVFSSFPLISKTCRYLLPVGHS